VASLEDDNEWAAAEQEGEEWECVACNKSFRSEAAWNSHERSRKHLKEVERLKAEMEEEDEELQLDDNGSDVEAEVDEAEEPVADDTVTLPPESDGEEISVADGIGDGRPTRAPRYQPHADPEAVEKQNTSLDPDAGARLNCTSDAQEKRTHGRKSTQLESDAQSRGSDDGGIRETLLAAPTKREKRRAREAAKKAQGHVPSLTCNICGESFPSKTKLFAHVKDEGHAAASLTIDKQADQDRKRGKKRK